MSIADKAFQLASEVLANGEKSAANSFGVEGTNDEVVVLVVRQRKGVVKLSEWSQRVQFQGSGAPCTYCNGTGRG